MSIPIAYDDKNNPVKIPKELLPIKLPEINKLDATGNPLDKMEDWKKIKINGIEHKKKHTLDTFVDFLGIF